MVDTFTEHHGHPECLEGFTSKTTFNGTHTMVDIRSNIQDAMPLSDPENYKLIVNIYDTKTSKYVLLNKDYIDSYQPFRRQNTHLPLETEGISESQIVYLKASWQLKGYGPTFTKIMPSHSTTSSSVNVSFDSQQASSNEGSKHAISNIPTLPNTDLNQNVTKRKSNQLDNQNNTSNDTEKLDIPKDFWPSLSDFISQPISDNFDRNELDPYLYNFLDDNNHEGTSDCLPKTSNSDTVSKTVQYTTEPMQFSDTENLSNTYTCLSNNTTFVSQNTNVYQASTTCGSVQNQTKSAHKKKKTNASVFIPSTIRTIKFQAISYEDIPYDASIVQPISIFNRNAMLRFVRNVDKYHRLQYLSNRDPVKSNSQPGRSIIPVQGDKTDFSNKKDHVLPILGIPHMYQQMIANETSVYMYVACVTENWDEKTGDVEYFIVGNKIFLEYANTKYEKSATQTFVSLTQENTNNGEHELDVTIVKVKHQIANETGPILFKLSAQYIKNAQSFGFEFGKADPLHRLAIFLLTLDQETKKYILNWNTLCLSDYIHQHKNEQEKEEQNKDSQ